MKLYVPAPKFRGTPDAIEFPFIVNAGVPTPIATEQVGVIDVPYVLGLVLSNVKEVWEFALFTSKVPWDISEE